MSTAQQLPSNVQPFRAAPPQLASIEEESLDLRRITATLRRRKIMIAAMAAIGTMLSAFYVSGLTPLYKAESIVVVEPERKKVVNIDQVAQNINPDWLTPVTEAAIIRSRDTALEVVERLDLVNHPAFNAALRPPQPGTLEIGKAWLARGLTLVGIETEFAAKREPAAALAPARSLEPEHLSAPSWAAWRAFRSNGRG
jgi:uncharacterized protein involved in exopolysaccharide biosynthesis